MRRVRTGKDVFQSAVDRMMDVYKEGHTVVCSFSGGKDSGVCLEVCIEAAAACGRLPVHVVYREEEILYPGTHEFLHRTHNRPEVDFHWLCAHQPSMNVFNRANPYWWVNDPSLPREKHVEPLPDFAEIIQEQNIEHIVHPARFPVEDGKYLVDVVGLRVTESAKRLLGLTSSGGYLTHPRRRHGVMYRKARPIYDWTDGDVWLAHKENGWDYNEAYNVMHAMKVGAQALRIGPPTLTIYGADMLRMASRAWPKWFDRVCERLEGVRQAAQFGSKVCRPSRRSNETWQDTFMRCCIDEAPAEWIRERSQKLLEHVLVTHAKHSTEPLPQTRPCMDCGGGGICSWRKLAEVAFNGDPFGLKLQSLSRTKFAPLEPEFFRQGAGTWNGAPTW